MTLNEAHGGQAIRICTVPSGPSGLEAIRLGVRAGIVAQVVQTLRRGPVVVQVGQSQIAIGYGLAQQIQVEPFEAG